MCEDENKIQIDSIIYSLNESNNTANIIGSDTENGDIFIPRSITNNTKEYIVESILSMRPEILSEFI